MYKLSRNWLTNIYLYFFCISYLIVSRKVEIFNDTEYLKRVKVKEFLKERL